MQVVSIHPTSLSTRGSLPLPGLPHCRAGAARTLETTYRAARYTVRAEHHELDDAFPEWGESNS